MSKFRFDIHLSTVIEVSEDSYEAAEKIALAQAVFNPTWPEVVGINEAGRQCEECGEYIPTFLETEIPFWDGKSCEHKDTCSKWEAYE